MPLHPNQTPNSPSEPTPCPSCGSSLCTRARPPILNLANCPICAARAPPSTSSLETTTSAISNSIAPVGDSPLPSDVRSVSQTASAALDLNALGQHASHAVHSGFSVIMERFLTDLSDATLTHAAMYEVVALPTSFHALLLGEIHSRRHSVRATRGSTATTLTLEGDESQRRGRSSRASGLDPMAGLGTWTEDEREGDVRPADIDMDDVQ